MSAGLWLVWAMLFWGPVQQASPSFERHFSADAKGTPFVANLAAESTLSLSVLVTTAIVNGAVKRSLGGSPPCRTLDDGARCDPAGLWMIDRRSLHLHSRAWSRVSDIGQGLALGGSAAAVLVDAFAQTQGAPYLDVLTDGVVLLESVAVATAAGQVLKFAVRRPRPQLYTLGTARGVEAELSFPSGHTTATACALTAWATLFAHRHPASAWRFVPYALSGIATGLVAYGRVATPKHFASDVLAGAVLGASIGLAVPLLHLRKEGPALAVSMVAHHVPAGGKIPVGLALSGNL